MTTVRRVALVTGGAQGIGAAIASRLANDGHDVAIIDRDAEACAAAAARVELSGKRVRPVAADVTDEDAVQAAVSEVAESLGPPVILVNNAGVIDESPIHRMRTVDWRRLIEVNLTGAFLMTREAQVHMTAARWGRIVNMSSTAAVGDVGLAHYSTAKAGLIGFTKTLALELGRFGVTANVVAPGFTVTDMTRQVAARHNIDFDDMVAHEAKRVAVGRTGTPEDLANAVAFFVDARSGFVSGQVLFVAGGPVGGQ